MTETIKLLVTRPEPEAARTADALAASGLIPVVAPLLTPVSHPATLPGPEAYSAIALTSPSAVRFLAALDPEPDVLSKPVFAVGKATQDAAIAAGFVSTRAAQNTLATLAMLIADTHAGGTILHPGARNLSGDLGAALAPFAIPVLTIITYAMEQARTLPPAVRHELLSGKIAGALFFSRRTAEAFAKLTAASDFQPVRARLKCLCISENCASPLNQNHFLSIAIADQPTHEAMMALALAFARDQIRA